MKQTDCIIIVGYAYEFHNSLETEVVNLLKHENRRVIAAKDVPDYQEQLLEQIRIINATHPHTAQIEASFHNPGIPCLPDDQTLRFKVGGIDQMLISFTIYSSTRNTL